MVTLSGESEDNIIGKELELKNLEKKKKEAKTLLMTLDDVENQLKDKLDEEISFTSESANETFSVLKFTPEVKEIEDYVIKIKQVEENLRNLRKEAGELQSKKLGFFESKAKHEEKVNGAWKKAKDLENNEYKSLVESLHYVLGKKNDALARLWFPTKYPGVNIDWQKEIKFEAPMKLGEALLKIKDYLNPIANQEISKDQQDLINKYKEAKQKFEEVKREILISEKR